VRRLIGDEIVLNNAPESASDDEVNVGVVAERAVVDVASITVPHGQTICPSGVRLPHVTAVVREGATGDLEALSPHFHPGFADGIHRYDVGDGPIASRQDNVAQFPVPRTLVAALAESIGKIAVENEGFERIVVARGRATIVVCHQNVTVKIWCRSQRRTVVSVGLTAQDRATGDDFERRIDVVNTAVLEDYGPACVQAPLDIGGGCAAGNGFRAIGLRPGCRGGTDDKNSRESQQGDGAHCQRMVDR